MSDKPDKCPINQTDLAERLAEEGAKRIFPDEYGWHHGKAYDCLLPLFRRAVEGSKGGEG